MAEKMRYGSNENESGNVDDEFNNANEELYPEDIYRVYMEEIAAIPPCSEEENEKLLGEIRSGNKAARERLIEGNLKNALFFVQDYINKGVPMADLIQEASMELMMLADEGFEGSFEKLLESRIRVRMEEIINDQKKETDIEEEMLARVNVLQVCVRIVVSGAMAPAVPAPMESRMWRTAFCAMASGRSSKVVRTTKRANSAHLV